MASWIKRVFNKLLGRKTEEPAAPVKAAPAKSAKPSAARAGGTSRREDDWASNPLNPLNPLNPIFNAAQSGETRHHHAPAPTHHHTHTPAPDTSTHHQTTTHHDTSTFTHHSTSFDFGGGFSHHH